MTKKQCQEFVSISKMEFDWIKDSIGVLFISHNDIEHQMFLSCINPLFDKGLFSKSPLKFVDSENSQIYYIGRFESQRIVYTKTSHMGAVKPFGSINTIHHALAKWKPLIIIMLGICAGLKNQQIGDVVVARELISYEEGKQFDNLFISRASYYYPGEVYKLFDNLDLDQISNDGSKFRIYKGSYLCGEKLVDSPDFKKSLLEKFPESEALEMEGHGVGSACVSNKLYNWIIVKGICDYAENKNNNGNKSDNQRKAMLNAILVARNIFKEDMNFDGINQYILNRKPIVRNVFISTSYLDETDEEAKDLFININDAYDFCRELAYTIANSHLIIHTGAGKFTGNAVICGIDDFIVENDLDKDLLFRYSDYYSAYVFSRPYDNRVSNLSLEHYKQRHREMMIRNIFSSIFVFGCKSVDHKVVNADGIYSEFLVSKSANKFIIPVGATGFMSKEIWKIIRNDIDKYYPILERDNQDLNEIRARKALRDELFNNLNIDIDFSKKDERTRLINSIMDFMTQPWR